MDRAASTQLATSGVDAPARWRVAVRWLERSWVLACLVAGVGVVYARTLLPGLHEFGDVTKAQFLGRVLGITHPTGYPLYILATAPLARLELGTLALRINAFSAVTGLGAVMLVYLTLRRLQVSAFAAAPVALGFAFAKTSWEQFTIAEVYALGAFLVGLVFYCLASWFETQRRTWFMAAAFVYALSFGNHLTVVTLLPAFALATCLGPWRALPIGSTSAWVLGSILLGMGQYAYLFWASASDSPYLEYRIVDFASFADYVSGSNFRRVMFAFSLEETLTERVPRFVRLVFRDLGWLCWLAPLGVAAALLPGRGPRAGRMVLVLLLAGLGELAWLLIYDIPDIDVYVIPLLLIVCLLAGLGAAWTLSQVSALTCRCFERWPVGGERARALAPWVVSGVFALALLGLVVPAARRHEPSHAEAESFTRGIDRDLAELGRGAIVVGAIPYSARMGFVHRLYGEGASRARDLHLAPMAKPKDVQKYLRARGHLRDSHLRLRLEPGRRVFVHGGGAGVDYGPDVRKVRRGRLLELVPKGRAKSRRLRSRQSP